MRRTTIFSILALALCLLSARAEGRQGNTYLVTDYGAMADGKTNDAAAIQRAIDACTAAGGGTVWVPAGDYLCTTILLKDNVTLHLDNGATLYASRRMEDYGRSLQVGAADTDSVKVLVGAANARNIAISGKGTLHCRAEREAYRRSPQTAVTDSVTGREIANAARYGADYQSKFRKVPPFTGAINFTGCTDVHIRDIRVIESNFWSVHLQWCERVCVDGIYIYSDPDNGVNADGLDIDGCSSVRVSNCVIRTGDDALCLKTTLCGGQSRPCSGVTVTNCLLSSSSAALKIGTESHADFEDIVVSNCVIDRANRGLNMIIRDGGTVRRVLFSNLTIHTVRKATFWWGNGDPLWFTVQRRKGAARAGGIEQVTLRDITACGQSGVRMEAFDGDIRDISIRDFHLTMEPEDAIDKRARNGFLFYGVKDLSMTDCRMNWDLTHPQPEWESAYLFDHVDGLELVRIRGRQAPGGQYPAFRYLHVTEGTADGKEITSTTLSETRP